jgi:hypothetical protein
MNDLELGERTFPLTEHGEQLEQENPQIKISWVTAYLLLQLGQACIQVACLYQLF